MADTAQLLDPVVINSLVASLIAEIPQGHWSLQGKDTQTGQLLLQMPAAQQKQLVIALVKRAVHDEAQSYSFRLVQLASDLWRKRLSFTGDELVELLGWLTGYDRIRFLSLGYLAKQIGYYIEAQPLSEKLRETIAAFADYLSLEDGDADLRKQIIALRHYAGTFATKLPLVNGDAWADRAIADIAAMASPLQQTWGELFTVLLQANGSVPTSKWWKAAEAALDKLGFEPFKHVILVWFPLVDAARTIPVRPRYHGEPDQNQTLIDANADLLRPLVWLCGRQEDREIARSLTTLAVSTYRKLTGIGPRCVRVGNACVWALGNMPGLTGIQQLALLKVKVKFGTAQSGIEKALTSAAEREKMPRDEIEELSTPTYGLSTVGLRREEFGDFVAELQVVGSQASAIRWFKADGKEQKSTPQSVKNDYAEDLKELQQANKDIQKMLPALAERLDNMFLAQKEWNYEIWQERYLTHPLMGVLAQRLIWRFVSDQQTVDAMWHTNSFVDCQGQPLAAFSPQTKVTLWHPITATTETILQWRSCLEQLQIQQPFKQAHREIYLLTAAELQTTGYSNRFAAHILKQHQFNGLCAVRGWRNKLRLMVDDSYPPAMKELPEWGLRAEFWIEGIGDNYGADTNESGVYLRVTTDQVRFYAIDANLNYAHAGGGGYAGHQWRQETEPTPLRLDAIPPLVFSEIMRDVDLFVGVASVGNDPTWQDGGPEGRHRNYWVDYAFGELSETAKTRKAVLERLVPKLKIAKQCAIQERFLHVRGILRTYRIHLGSGNIMMEPNNQYLCIVPQSASAPDVSGKLFLPFEGDRTLAIILSKAFLLANDTAITDETILRQIK